MDRIGFGVEACVLMNPIHRASDVENTRHFGATSCSNDVGALLLVLIGWFLGEIGMKKIKFTIVFNGVLRFPPMARALMA